MNRKLPAPLKAHIMKYGQNKGTDFKDPAMNRAEKRMMATMDSVEGNLDHLSEALKTRFKALLVSQLSLLRYKDVNTDKNIQSVNEKQGSLQRSTDSGDQIYIKRCSLKTAHTAASPQDVYGQSTSFDVSGKENTYKTANKRNLSQDEDRLMTGEYLSSISPRFKNSTCSTDYISKSGILQNLTRISPAADDSRKERSPDSKTRTPTITTSSTRYRSPQSPVRTLTDTLLKRESTIGSEAADNQEFKGPYAVGGRCDKRPSAHSAVNSLIDNQQIATSGRAKTSERGLSKENVESTKTLSHTSSKKSPMPPCLPQVRGGAMPKSPVRVSLSSQLEKEKTEIKSSISETHRNAKLRNRFRTKSISPKDVSRTPKTVQSANTGVVSPTTDRRVSPTDDTLKGIYVELSQYSLDTDFIASRNDLNNEKSNENGKSKHHQSLHNQFKSCNTNETKYVDNEDIPPAGIERIDTKVDTSKIKSQGIDRGADRSQLGLQNALKGQHNLSVNGRCIESKQNGYIEHKSTQKTHTDLPSTHSVRDSASQPRGYTRPPNTLDERLDRQLKKKLLLNAVRTLICVTHDAVQRMMEEDFDLGIWTAIYKNVRGVEAELEEFSTTFISDEILPPETAVTEAEDRLKTRLDVLFSLNNGRKRFQASEATRQDVMVNVELLKSTSFKHGAATQNEMLFSEMKHVVIEIKNLAEVFQVCGERFSKRLKEGDNHFHSLDRGNGFSLFLKKCFLGGATGDEENVDDDNNHCIRRSSSLDALADMCSGVFSRMSDVQKALIIIVFVGLVVYMVSECLSGACGTARAVGDMWNNLYILRYGPPTV